MGDENETEEGNEDQQGSGEESSLIKDLRAQLKTAQSENRTFRVDKLFAEAGLADLDADRKSAIKHLAGDGKWTPELLKEKAKNLGFITPGPDPAPGAPPTPPTPPTPTPDPNLSTIDRINAASASMTAPGGPTDDFNARMQAATSADELMQIIAADKGKHGILADSDIE
jgi:hypothetical protein